LSIQYILPTNFFSHVKSINKSYFISECFPSVTVFSCSVGIWTNASVIFLIPKFPKAYSVKDFRPIIVADFFIQNHI